MADLTPTARELLAAADRRELVRDFFGAPWLWMFPQNGGHSYLRELTDDEKTSLQKLVQAGLLISPPPEGVRNRHYAVTDKAHEGAVTDMAQLEATPELVATARRAAGRDWTVGPEGAAAMTTDPHLAQLVTAGLIRMVYTPAHRLADDYWTLTDAGQAWLAAHDTADHTCSNCEGIDPASCPFNPQETTRA